MSRYQRLDADEERIEPGIQRVGYDADSQRYTYRDANGQYWESAEGNEYGPLHRPGERSNSTMSKREYDRQRYGFWKYFGPVVVLISVVLLLLFRFLSSAPAPRKCEPGFERYVVKSGDTCWDIAQSRDLSVKELTDLNPDMDCDVLLPSEQLCLPQV